MFSRNSLFPYIILIMFSLFGKVNADYDKIFFELNVKNIDNNEINLENYKNKTILFNKKIIN